LGFVGIPVLASNTFIRYMFYINIFLMTGIILPLNPPLNYIFL
jgi:hypothetical protein